MADDITYQAALAELEGILAAIEEEQVDVDELAVKVRRSAELIRVCRAKIDAAAIEVEAVVQELEPGEKSNG
ncbi:MAG: exodeoxyribonuclease VII small subunit [Acidimicrobiia bacterium]|nr:exodeoxyribonuclease VII small subunit [Acidimicrobiia bacterium]